VLNAADAMPEGGTLTVVTASAEEAAGNRIILSITDTGCGVPRENKEKIFDPFFTTKQPGKGTGLGLSNAYRIVELAGGKISFSSAPGKGTAFTVKLPFVEE
jgi:signal transduction histidine kinase